MSNKKLAEKITSNLIVYGFLEHGEQKDVVDIIFRHISAKNLLPPEPKGKVVEAWVSDGFLYAAKAQNPNYSLAYSMSLKGDSNLDNKILITIPEPEFSQETKDELVKFCNDNDLTVEGFYKLAKELFKDGGE